MLILIRGLFFESGNVNTEPYRDDAVINDDEIVSIVRADYQVRRWLSGGQAVKIAMRNNGGIAYAQGEPKDFVKGDD